MFARVARRLQSYGIGTGRALLLECHHHHSTTTTAAAVSGQKDGFLEDYLVASLGFSKDEAISTLSKVTPRLKPVKKDPDLVIGFFEDLGLNRTQIKSLIWSQPDLLLSKVDKTLKPKIEFLRGLGLSGLDLAKFIMANKSLLDTGLNSHIKPRIEFLRKLLGDDEKLALVLKRCPSLLVYHASKTIEQNILSLRKIGFSDKNVLKFIIRRPKSLLMQKDGWIEDIGQRVENELGISPKSSLFYFGVEILCSYKQATLDAKYLVFKSYGWSDMDIATLVKVYPLVLAASEDKLTKILDFLMNEVGLLPDYMATRGKFFSVGLERRLFLRYEVLKVLNEKKLNKRKRKSSLYSVICLPEHRFVKDYLLPYMEEVPDLCKSYAERVGS